jgi:PPK2 family polyphosphate:nucleotide phosphotransferase
MKIDTQKFRVPEGAVVDLKDWSTRVSPFYESKGDYETALTAQIAKLKSRQNLLYAHDRYALLLVFQAMDAAGKDSMIKHVMSGINPQGCQVFSFKQPSEQELDHDFLWRSNNCLPERGRIGIFNRSYYEDVLVVRVHPELLRAKGLPQEAADDPNIWQHRYESINSMERHLHRNGTRIVKFFLHLSQEEQRLRFLARLDDPEKNWKFTLADIEEREKWPKYMNAYSVCLSATSTQDAPWYVIPADDKQNARLIVSQVVAETMDTFKMSYPPPTLSTKELAQIRKKLAGSAPASRP